MNTNLSKLVLVLACLLLSSNGWAETLDNETVLQTIAMESSSESIEGQAMVARVILNRARASNKSLKAVCLAPKQFSAWNSRFKARAWLDKHYTPIVRQRAQEALNQAILEPGNQGIKHYHTKSVRPKWARGHKPSLVIGSHWFYEGIR